MEEVKLENAPLIAQKGFSKNRLSLKEQLEQQTSAERKSFQEDVQRLKRQYRPTTGSAKLTKTYKIAPFDAKEEGQ